MIRRREAIQVFSTSFLDVLACALGAVVFLLMQTANRTHEQAQVYNARIANLDEDVSGLKNGLADAREGRKTAEGERDNAANRAERAEDDKNKANRERADAEAEAGKYKEKKDDADDARRDSFFSLA